MWSPRSGTEQKNEENGERSIQRPDKGFVDTEVHGLFEIFIRTFEHVFSNPVEDNDRIMHTIAGDRESTGDK